ncbi:MAG: tetratricopeptide repeat protein, partial [Candidatus Promineifilaceae bacterium]
QHFPIQAMNFIRSEGLPGPVLNNLGDGGYLIFEGGPGSVYSDGRLEVYGGEYVEQAIRLFQTGEGLNEVVGRYGIQTILLRHYSDQGLMNKLEADTDWQPVYYDSHYIVYLHQSAETADLIERLAIDWQNPDQVTLPLPEWLPPPLLTGIFPSVGRNREQLLLGELFLSVGNLDRALAYFDDAIPLAPVNETVYFYEGIIFRAQGDERKAAEYFAMLDENFLKQSAAQVFAGRIYSKAGNNRAALAAYQQAVALGGRTEGNYRELIRLALLQEDYPAAITGMVELAQLRPQDASIWNELGLLYVQLGDTDRAKMAFEQALMVDEGFEAARENLARLNNE